MADWYFRNKQPNSVQACPGCRNLVRKSEEFCPFCAKRLRSEGGVRGLAAKAFRRQDSVTMMLLGAILFMFLMQMVVEFLLPGQLQDRGRGGGLLNFPPTSRVTYVLLGANAQWLVGAYHQYWRLFTYCFLHIGLLHIVFNSWALRDLGRITEIFWGHRQVFSSFVLTGIVAGATSYLWGTVLTGTPRLSAGASGAICGLLGLMLGAYYKNRYHVGEQLGSQLRQWAVYILVFGLVAGADNAAHIGGMLAGAALGYYLPPTRTTSTPERDAKVWNILTWISLAVALICVGFAIHFAVTGMISILAR